MSFHCHQVSYTLLTIFLLFSTFFLYTGAFTSALWVSPSMTTLALNIVETVIIPNVGLLVKQGIVSNSKCVLHCFSFSV